MSTGNKENNNFNIQNSEAFIKEDEIEEGEIPNPLPRLLTPLKTVSFSCLLLVF